MPDDTQNSPQLNYLTLWLNYEKKIDDLKGHFLTFAGLLFALQSGIFALMLDKIFLSEKQSPQQLPAEYLLIALSVLTFIFFFSATIHYASHIKNNIKRSGFVQRQDANITEFKEKQERDIRGDKYREESHRNRSPHTDSVIFAAAFIYGFVFLATIVIPYIKF